ncbi:MAG TPA: methanogenesis marker 17 protein [Halobacteria archaeon]|jgi:putative methanogenesis marker protein 17|nr:methanogenesis marker 17 protein [Halobacteria archaeon]
MAEFTEKFDIELYNVSLTYLEEEISVLDKVIRDVISTLNLSNTITKMKVFMDPKETYFVIAANLASPAPPILLKNVSAISLKGGKIAISVFNEEYMPTILKFLWDQFGRENIEQPERLEIIITAPNAEIDNISKFVVEDPSSVILNKLIDAFDRIKPEGFRVTKYYYDKKSVYLIASEDTIKDEWSKTAERILNEIKGCE